ncbi:ribosome biogenesis protein Urb1 [Pseudozyma hubeiensis SY62]|uniref:Ribosome biogenesis protein Urb1 n=1 Tax=Pseudozyma hubeiensis (strain SY62) TaxID=1305764 RepID=R9PA55_PSEHS|nr:ribosome biogenesis protein Urb1 [Pseudozyma hubeiensis SY62]GAC98137.1 ribosome biogenesis protein Urb1 [Pseudozyma hubeiensis SY62]
MLCDSIFSDGVSVECSRHFGRFANPKLPTHCSRNPATFEWHSKCRCDMILRVPTQNRKIANNQDITQSTRDRQTESSKRSRDAQSMDDLARYLRRGSGMDERLAYDMTVSELTNISSWEAGGSSSSCSRR